MTGPRIYPRKPLGYVSGLLVFVFGFNILELEKTFFFVPFFSSLWSKCRVDNDAFVKEEDDNGQCGYEVIIIWLLFLRNLV